MQLKASRNWVGLLRLADATSRVKSRPTESELISKIESQDELQGKAVTARDRAPIAATAAMLGIGRTEGQLLLLRILPLTVPFFLIG